MPRAAWRAARRLPVDGPAWQVMRLSRNRNWGHPELVALVERLAREAKENDGWNGLLVGDLPSRAAGRCCRATPAIRSASMPMSG